MRDEKFYITGNIYADTLCEICRAVSIISWASRMDAVSASAE